MKKIRALFFSVLGLYCLDFSQGQTSTPDQNFNATDTLDISEVEDVKMQWIDLNHDLSYDLFIWGKAVDSTNTAIEIYLNDGLGFMTKQTVTIPKLTIGELQLKDHNRDRIVDIVFSGVINGTDSVISVLAGAADFSFQLIPQALVDEPVETFSMLDLDYDTVDDLIIGQRSLTTDSLEFKVLEGTPTGFIPTTVTIPTFQTARLFTFDTDSDGRKDLIFSGIKLGTSNTSVLMNNGDFEFEDTSVPHGLTSNIIEELTFGEYDGNRYPDFFSSGKNGNGIQWNNIYANKGDIIDLDQTILTSYEVESSLMVDFDFDGKTDLWVEAEKNDSTFLFWYSDLEDFTEVTGIYRDSLISTSFADLNLDGHIDYAELQQGETNLEVVLFINQLPDENFGPFKPLPQVAVQTGPGEMKISWQSGLDSLTDVESVSYDALFMSMDTVALFEANLSTGNFWPIRPAHGNQLYADELVLDELPAGDYLYLVRAMDNAFNFLPKGGIGGLGSGDGSEEELGRATICAEEAVVSNVEMCNGSFEIFGKDGINRNWYSERLGAIGQGDLLTYTAGGIDDVIYGSVRQSVNCAEGQLVINIKILDDAPNAIPIDAFNQICGEQELVFNLPDEWTNIAWVSTRFGSLGGSNILSLDVSESDTIRVQATNSEGCKFQAQSIISFVEFDPAVADSVFSIELGEGVNMLASGGTSYVWTPANGLSNPFGQSTIATPRETTIYSVLIRNAEGCNETLNVRVNVEQVGAAANLFSPNGDNRNDSFFLQLSSVPAAIDFRVYTREGNLIYRDREVQRALSRGWDGTFNGKKMPPGVYYWRVEGVYNDGQRVVVNEKNGGKVHLIR